MRAKAIVAFLAAIATAALLLPAGSEAKPGHATTIETPAQVVESMSLRGTHGYRLDLTGRGKRGVTVTADKVVAKTALLSAIFSVRAGDENGSGLHVDLGDRGRIDLRFVPRRVKEQPLPKGCTGDPSKLERGVFVGSIHFSGERGFTQVDAHRVRGTVERTGATRCHRDPGNGIEGEATTVVGGAGRPAQKNPEPEARALRVISANSAGTDRFEAIADESAAFPEIQERIFLALTDEKEGGLSIMRAAVAFDGPPSSVVAPAPGSPLTTATVEPPAPFSGSASFALTSPTSDTYTGDLAVELPGLGDVPLTGPGIAAGICRGYHCTKTLPKALRPRKSGRFAVSYFSP